MNDNAGHAGDAYLRYLLHPPVLEFAQKSLADWTQQIWDYTRLDSPHRFRVRAVGAIATAAALVNKLDILHFNTDRVIMWLLNGVAGELSGYLCVNWKNCANEIKSYDGSMIGCWQLVKRMRLLLNKFSVC